MKLNSIRWRLPISYALIALLAAASLGAVLLTTLRSYYAQRELDYLTGNAEVMASTLAPAIKAGSSVRALQPQLNSFAFLSQVKVRLLDADGEPVATSLAPGNFNLAVAAVPMVDSVVVGQGDTTVISYRSFIAISTESPDSSPLIPFATTNLPGGPDIIYLQPLAAAGTPYGFDLSAEAGPETRRSSQVVRQPLLDRRGQLLGYVELSEGPAYGGQVVGRVAGTWAIASAVAVALAAAAGWAMSRRMSAPLLALTATTARMAGGDLAARAETGRRALDEVELLACSFNDMAGQVEETIVALRRFVSDAAHELHTPLTALRTNLELAADECPQANPFLARAQAQVERLERLSASLLDLSRLEAGPAASRCAVDLVALVQQAGEVYASQAEQAGLAFSLELQPGVEQLVVEGNETQLRQAVDNLFDNAVKFTPEGGTVSVGLRPASIDGEPWAELWVQDTGIGIPADDVPQLFSRFHRGRNTAAYPGSGLGLAIVRAAVEGHGGTVNAESTGSGARFWVRLPLGPKR